MFAIVTAKLVRDRKAFTYGQLFDQKLFSIIIFTKGRKNKNEAIKGIIASLDIILMCKLEQIK